MSGSRVISVIGFGRFGQLLATILKDDFDVRVHDPIEDLANQADLLGVDFVSVNVALKSEVIFYSVPISRFAEILCQHAPILKHINDSKVVIDVLSVKSYPKQMFDKYLPANCQALLTHPMFGPDGVRRTGLAGQTIVMDKFRLSDDNFKFWKTYFADKELNVIEMSADEHDRLAARSQGVTHLIGRTLEEFGFAPTEIDTVNSRTLNEIKDEVLNDTWQLFADLQTFNPYAQTMRNDIHSALTKICTRLNDTAPHDIFAMETDV